MLWDIGERCKINDKQKISLFHIKVKTGMPSNVDGQMMNRCVAPVLVMAAEKDCLFLGRLNLY